MNTYTIKVPKSFWSDHVDRDCVSDEFGIVELSKHYKLSLSAQDLCELLDDAHHYATSGAEYGWDMQWLVSSARATKQAICKQIGRDELTRLWCELGKLYCTGRELGLDVQRAS